MKTPMVRRLSRSAAARALLPCAALFAAACGGSDYVDEPFPGPDAQGLDANADDVSLPSEAAPDQDALGVDRLDANRPDTSVVVDAGAVDGDARGADANAALLDAGVPDADAAPPATDALVEADAAIDARFSDAGLLDVSVADGGAGDAGAIDTGAIDASAGLDAGAEVDANLDASAEAEGAADAGIEAEAGDGGPDLLGSAKTFAVLAGTTITITPSPPLTTIVGDVGVSPGTSIATLPLGQPVGGNVYAGVPVALQAQTDLTTAYNTLAAMPCLPANDRTGVDLGGKTLAPGVYCFPNTSAGITGALVLDAQLDPNAVWVIQVGSTLTTAAGATVTVINGGSACNVYWQIGSSATLGTGTQLVGTIVAMTSITLVTGSTVLEGRALARNGFVALDGSTISAALCR